MTAEAPRIALATCSVLPQLDPDGAPLLRALAARGSDPSSAVWDDPEIDWSSFDLVVVRSTWDYSSRRDLFVEWAESVPHLLNGASALRWNTDKGYLRELEAAGIAVIPTLWLDPARALTSQAIHTRLPAQGDFVIKPVVSAGAKDTGRYQSGEAHSRGMAIRHVRDLLASGRHVMVQPYITSVDTAGERGLVFIDGEYSHSVRQNALLKGPHRPTRGLYQQEKKRPHEASDAEIDLARRALAVAAQSVGESDPSAFLYARVDLVTGNDGNPMVIELELTEPSLYLALKPGSLDHFADAIMGRLA